VLYEVFPRAFSPTGDLNGITARLDHIRDLGVTVVWLMPIQPVGEKNRKGRLGSPYSIRDFRAVSREYGTPDDLRRLVREARERGLRVILDFVANHSAWDNVLMATPEMYVRDADGQVQPPNEDWTDVAELDYDDPDLRAYMIETLRYWLREYDLDGFRCDVAGLVPTDFWEEARVELEKVKPDVFMLAEWSDPALLARAFDADYGWPFHATLSRVLGLGAPASELRTTWEEQRAKFGPGALHLRFSDNHDERRAVTRFGEPAALAASALVLTLDGIPLLYNGVEIGDPSESGDPALMERRPIFWAGAARRPWFLPFYRDMIALRHRHVALRRGFTVWLPNSDAARVVSYLRRGENEEILVTVNLSSQPWTGTVEVPEGGEWTEITPDIGLPVQPGGVVPERETRAVELPKLGLDAWGVRIFRR
jgi:glycosidase